MAGQQFRNRTIRVSVASGGHGGGHGTRSSSSSGGGGVERAPEAVLDAAALDQTLDRVNPNVLRDAVDAVRRIDAASPERARALLADNPQLAYALARALQRLALVDDATAQQLVLAPPPPVAPYDPAFVPQQPQMVPGAPFGFVAPAASPDVAAAMQHDPALQSMIQQLRELPLEEVMALPPETREQILHYRA